eukprot:gene6168-10175_t
MSTQQQMIKEEQTKNKSQQEVKESDITFDDLSDDELFYILSFLDLHSICTIDCVSKYWKFSKLSCDNSIWKSRAIPFLKMIETEYNTSIKIDRKESTGFKDAIKKSYWNPISLQNIEKYDPISTKQKYYGASLLSFGLSNIKLPPPQTPRSNYLKISIVGHNSAGKTALKEQLSLPMISDGDKSFKIEIFEIYIDQRMHVLQEKFGEYWGTGCFILCFDLNNIRSYKNLDHQVIKYRARCVGYLETSAITGKNVDKMIKAAITASCYQNSKSNCSIQ